MDTILVLCYAAWLVMVLLLAGSNPKGLRRDVRERGLKRAGGRYD
jgi:hypothetical protein